MGSPTSNRVRIVAIVCIAVFALTAIAAVQMFAALDALTPIDSLFAALPPAAAAPCMEDLALPAAPVADVRSSRGPPLS